MNSNENFIDADELREELETSKKLMLLDVRSSEEFASDYVEGAINIPLDELEARAHELQGASSIVTVCNLGGPRSCTAVKRIHDLGHAEVGPLRGGMRGWESGDSAEKADGIDLS